MGVADTSDRPCFVYVNAVAGRWNGNAVDIGPLGLVMAIIS